MGLRDLFFRITGRDQSGAALGSFGARLGKIDGALASTNEKMRRVGRRMRDLGAAGAVASVPIIAGFRDMFRVASTFEAAMNRANAVLQATTAQQALLSAAAREMGRTTKFSAGEAAGAIETLAKNGLQTAAIIGGALKGSLELAAIGKVDLADAADIATDAMASFRLPAEQMARVVQGAAGVMTASKFTIDDYRLALAQAGGVAGGLNVDLADFNATLAATASVFSSGSDAGTSFKTFLTRLVPESDAAAQGIEMIGLEAFDAAGRMLPMRDIAEQLRVGLGRLSGEDRTAALKKAFGVDAMRTAIALAEQGAAGFGRIEDAIAGTDAGGLAAANQKGLAGAVVRLRSAWEGLLISVSDSGFLDLATDGIGTLTRAINGLAEADPRLLRFGATLGAVGVAMSGLAGIAGVLALAVGTISAPVLAAAAGIGVAIAAVVAFWEEIRTLLRWITELGDTVRREIGERWTRLWGDAGDAVGTMVDKVESELGTRLSTAFRETIRNTSAVGRAFFDLYDAVVGNSYVPDMVDGIEREFGRLDGVMVDPARRVTDGVGALFGELQGAASRGIGAMLREGTADWSGFWSGLHNTATRWSGRIVDEAFGQLFDGAGQALGGLFAGGASAGGAPGGFSLSPAAGLLQGAGGFFSNLLGFREGGQFKVGGAGG
ncbi:MAG: phage tail tape measure protein, partial [Pseudomonadota bacterium]